jgi:hypothetical protein
MELKDLIAPNYRNTGLSCHNCAHLAREYDLDSDQSGVWICEKLPAHSAYTTFPFVNEMPCFELSFWLSIFAGNFGESISAYEDALSRFSESVALITPQLTHETVLPQKSGDIMQQLG